MTARRAVLALVALLTISCSDSEGRPDAAAQRTTTDTAALGDTLRGLVERAYDFSRTDVVGGIMSLYPAEGPIVSASAGRLTTSTDSLRAQIQHFWTESGQHMQQPRWEWVASHVRSLGPDAAVLSATYRIPHRTPEGRVHIIPGAWTMVFERRDGRWVIVHEHLSDQPSQ